MKKTTQVDQTIAELHRQLEAAQAEKKAAEKAEQKQLERAKRYASDNHTIGVLSLYDELGIEREHERPRRVKGEVRFVATDRDETHRMRRLLTYVRALVEAADPDLIERLQRADRDDRDERKPAPVEAPTEDVVEHAESAPAPSADEDENDGLSASDQALESEFEEQFGSSNAASWQTPYNRAA